MRTWIYAIAAVLVVAPRADARTIVHAGRLIDGVSNAPRERVSIVVDEGRIVEVAAGFLNAGAGDEVVDLSDHTVLPGLMDMHTHLAYELSRTSYMDEFVMNPTDVAIRSTHYARLTLMAGFTTVRDLGDDGMTTVALRKAIASGFAVGPRIFTAGKSIATTGGHADPTSGWCQALAGDPGPREGVVSGVDDARKAVRQRYKDGADLIKITATGGVLSMATSGDNAQFSDDELAAIVATGKDYGFIVAAHAHGSEGMLRAVNAGVASIEHGTYMNDEIMRAMKKKGTYYVPTILAGVTVADLATKEDYLPEVVRPKAARIGPQIKDTFTKAYQAGVKIAFGTDTGVSKHGENAREFELMVECGMPPMTAIQAATMEAAKLLRIADRLGSVEKGKIADLVAVKDDPLANISTLKDVRFVMKEGVVYKRDGAAVAR
jgi:imidazolonepropionase-like amidohydrolase